MRWIGVLVVACLRHASAQGAAQIGGAPPRHVQMDLCTIADVFGKLQGITTDADCRSGCALGDCPAGWMPAAADECNPQCGRVFEPFWDQCGAMLTEAHMGGMDEMGLFYASAAGLVGLASLLLLGENLLLDRSLLLKLFFGFVKEKKVLRKFCERDEGERRKRGNREIPQWNYSEMDVSR